MHDYIYRANISNKLGLRTRLNQENSTIDAKSLQKALEKAENDIKVFTNIFLKTALCFKLFKTKVKTDQFINHLNNQIQTLPQFDDEELHTVNYGVPLESVLNIQKPKKEIPLKKRLMSRSDSNPSIVLNQRFVVLQNCLYNYFLLLIFKNQ